MCYDCWVEAGKPQIDSPLIRETAQAINELYEIHSAGGDLHIVLDDWNVEDNHLDFCYNSILKDRELNFDDFALHIKIHNLLKKLNEEERLSVLALVDNLWV